MGKLKFAIVMAFNGVDSSVQDTVGN